MIFVARPLSENDGLFFGTHLNRVDWIQSWDWATNTTMGTEYSQHRCKKEKCVTWTSPESNLESIRNTYTSQEPLWKQLFASIKCLAQLCHCHNQEENASYHLLRREHLVRSQESTVNRQEAALQWIRSCWNTGVSFHSQVCFCNAMHWEPLLQKQHLQAWLKYEQLRRPYGEKLCVCWNKTGAVWSQCRGMCLAEERWSLEPQEHRVYCHAWWQ